MVRTKQTKKTLKEKDTNGVGSTIYNLNIFLIVLQYKISYAKCAAGWSCQPCNACLFWPSPINFFKGFRWLFITSNDLKINENLRPFWAKDRIAFFWTQATKIVLEITSENCCFGKPKNRWSSMIRVICELSEEQLNTIN